MLVTIGNWSNSTTTNHHNKTITTNVRDIKTGKKHWIDGKTWKYRTHKDLDRIKTFIDQLKIKAGILKKYDGGKPGQPNYDWIKTTHSP